jgi:hypothetical protein
MRTHFKGAPQAAKCPPLGFAANRMARASGFARDFSFPTFFKCSLTQCPSSQKVGASVIPNTIYIPIYLSIYLSIYIYIYTNTNASNA